MILSIFVTCFEKIFIFIRNKGDTDRAGKRDVVGFSLVMGFIDRKNNSFKFKPAKSNLLF